jgi:hypothetical protein
MSKKFIISEKEKSRISKIHNQRILKERVGLKEQQTPPPAATTPPPAATTPPPAATTPPPAATTPPPAATTPQQPVQTGTARYSTAVCPGKDTKTKCDNTVLKAQIRMNDECPSDVLTAKLLEDGVYGSKTGSAWTVCKPKLTPTKQVQGTAGNTIAQVQGDQVKTGEPITANDIATLTA